MYNSRNHDEPEVLIIHIIIDGYNLIGAQHRHIQGEREALIQLLVDYGKKKKHHITLVFDGWKNGRGNETKTVTGGVTVIYSGLGERADNVIERIIERREKRWVVVSSDREVEKAAWNYSSVPIDSDKFYSVMMKAVGITSGGQNNEDDVLQDEEEDFYRPARGNPHQRSKKQREIMRVLRKL